MSDQTPKRPKIEPIATGDGEKNPPKNPIMQLSEDLRLLSPALNVYLGSALSQGLVDRNEITATDQLYNRVVGNAQKLARQVVELSQRLEASEKRAGQLEQEVVELRIYKRDHPDTELITEDEPGVEDEPDPSEVVKAGANGDTGGTD